MTAVVTLDRLQRVRARLAALQVDALLVTTPTNRRWVSGFTGTAGVVLVSGERALLATDARYYEQVGTQAPASELLRANGPLAQWLPALLAGLGGKRIGFEPADLTFAAYEEWTQAIAALPAADRPQLVPAPRAIEALRAIKEPGEVDALTRAVLLGDAACEHARAVAQPGMTEKALAWAIQTYAMEHGADDLSFPTIIATGPWGALPHAYPREVPLAAGQGVVMDLGVRVDGYCSDLTRTICLGTPDAQFRTIYDIVLTAQETAEERIEAGMTGEQAHQIAMTVIAQAGYGEQFGHGLGHGVGLDIHEAPRLGPRSTDVLEDGQVVTVEPGIYIPGWGGVRVEDQCVMEGGRLRRLSTASKLDLTTDGSAAPVISLGEIKRGVAVEVDGTLYQVLEVEHVKTKKSAVYKVKLRDLRAGHIIERSFNAGAKLTTARVERRDMQYLYSDPDALTFMNTQTFDQITVPRSIAGNAVDYLKEGAVVQVLTYGEEALGVEMPASVTLKIVRSDPGVKGDTATGATKPATMETGLVVDVPLFINEGDTIKVSTSNGNYIERSATA